MDSTNGNNLVIHALKSQSKKQNPLIYIKTLKFM